MTVAPDTVRVGPESEPPPILIVGAGPTGLALAAQLESFGIGYRIIDRAPAPGTESRALAVQARTLELLQSVGLADDLVARGNPSARLVLHFDGRPGAEIVLGGFAATDTRFPFILFVSQAETEAVLAGYLAWHGTPIERGVEFLGCTQDADGVACSLRHADGREERVQPAYLVGCDGAHSAVRKAAGLPFVGDAYLQDFMLGDVEADERSPGTLPRGALHAYAARGRTAMFFPLGRPTTWRVIAISQPAANQSRRSSDTAEPNQRSVISLAELQVVVDSATGGLVRLRDPAWLAHFRLHHRQAARYREGRVFIAGDAGHIHSPVGAQGMNTGIQDAWNLGWKLAYVISGVASPDLFDTYEAERWPVGHALLRYTDRAFGIFVRTMGNNVIADWIRRAVVAPLLPRFMRSGRLRRAAFRFVSELGISYRQSRLAVEGEPRLVKGPKAGDRLPDAELTRDGRSARLQQELTGPSLGLLLAGDDATWSEWKDEIDQLVRRYRGIVAVRRLSRSPVPGALFDPGGLTFAALGVRDTAQYLVRPDGYIGYRCAGHDLAGIERYLERWFGGTATTPYPETR